MRRLTASRGYARFRMATGAVLMLLGAVIFARTIVETGWRKEDVAPFVLSAALVALGAVRISQARALLRSGS